MSILVEDNVYLDYDFVDRVCGSDNSIWDFDTRSVESEGEI